MRKIPSAAMCASWLEQVAQALDQAQAVIERMGDRGHDRAARHELIERIQAARRLTRALQLSSERRKTQPFHPQ
jgi:hypothetical protein